MSSLASERRHVDVLSREEFLDDFSHQYGSGQHVTFLGPTQRGKTTLCHQMLYVVISPKHPATLLAGKPPHRDPVMAQAARRLNLEIVEEWPPSTLQRYRARNKNGWVVRPKQSMRDLDADRANVARHFRGAMLDNYAAPSPHITVSDEAHLIQNEYKLRQEYEAPLMRGAPHNSQWSLLQRGRNASYLAYNSPEWILLAYDPDVENQKRYADIGGVDPRYLRVILPQLRTATGDDGRSTVSEFLCIKRSGPELFIVDIA